MLLNISDYIDLRCFSVYFECLLKTKNKSYIELFKHCVSKAVGRSSSIDLTSGFVLTATALGLVGCIGVIAGKCIFKKQKSSDERLWEKQEVFRSADKSIYCSKKLNEAFTPELKEDYKELLNMMDKKNIWSDEAFREKFSCFLKTYFPLTKVLFQELKRKSQKHPLKNLSQKELMAELLIYNEPKEGHPNYSKYFYIFAELYHLARSGAYFDRDSNRYVYPYLKQGSDWAFFDKERLEFEWRKLSNVFNNRFLSLNIADEVRQRNVLIWKHGCFKDYAPLKKNGYIDLPALYPSVKERQSTSARGRKD